MYVYVNIYTWGKQIRCQSFLARISTWFVSDARRPAGGNSYNETSKIHRNLLNSVEI